MTDARARRPDAATLERAAAWYLDLRDAAPDALVYQEHARWLALDPTHRQAWERVQRLQHAFGQLPEPVGRETFLSARASRRHLIKKLGVVLLAGGTATLGWRHRDDLQHELHALAASHRTATGERREIVLADGGRMVLNTGTVVDVRYAAARRDLILYAGEVLVTTAPDPQQRPFIVHTRHGSIHALGTRFSVRDDRADSLVQVFEHAVAIRPAKGGGSGVGNDTLRLTAGQQVRFSATAIQPAAALEANADAWRNGLLAVDNWPLGRLVGELARHYTGHLGCDPAIASLNVSGVFHLDDIPGVLQNLSATLPIRVVYRTRYWVCVTTA